MLMGATLMICATTWSDRRLDPDLPGPPMSHEASSIEPLEPTSALHAYGDLDASESRAPAADAELKLKILRLLTQQPGLDDVDLADAIGAVPFEVSKLLRQLAEEGLVEEAA